MRFRVLAVNSLPLRSRLILRTITGGTRMAATSNSFETWLQQAQIPTARLTRQQHSLLQAAFRFHLSLGSDYYSNRLLGHFLLHCGSGLKVAAIARLLGISRPTASRQQALSSKQAIQQAHHRMD